MLCYSHSWFVKYRFQSLYLKSYGFSMEEIISTTISKSLLCNGMKWLCVVDVLPTWGWELGTHRQQRRERLVIFKVHHRLNLPSFRTFNFQVNFDAKIVLFFAITHLDINDFVFIFASLHFYLTCKNRIEYNPSYVFALYRAWTYLSSLFII
jgi:hypothetical protein